MKTCFYTILQKNYSGCIESDLFIKSFKYFHPDIPLFIVDDDLIARLIAETPGLDFYNMKASAAKLFYDEYELVVNIDADHFIFGRMDEILEGDFDVAAPSNYNYYENVGVSLTSYRGNVYNIIPEEKYAQAGLIASTSKEFWKTYEKASLLHAPHMTCRDNDVLNMVLQFGNYNFKVLDGGWTPTDPNRYCYYGCSSLSLESKVQLINDTPCIDNIPIRCYHVARGSAKPKFAQLFPQPITNWFNDRIQKIT